MKATRLIGALVAHWTCGTDVARLEKPDAGQGDVLFFREAIDDHAQYAVEPALLTHFEQQTLQCA